MTAGEAIKKALLLIGAVDRFREPDANEYSDGLASLNQLLRRLGVDRLGIHKAATVTHVLTPSTGSYTIGATGVIATTRPHKILTATVTIDGQDYELDEITRDEYLTICDKDITGTPEWFFYDPTYATGTIYLYPFPGGAYTLNLSLQQPLTEYSAITETLALPPEYISHIPWGLCVDIAPEYGSQAPDSVVMRADETLRQLKRLHSIPTNKLNTDPFHPCGNRTYDIITGA